MGNIMDDWFGIESGGGGSSGGTQPDPKDAADTQYQYNKQAIIDSSMYGNIDQYGPYGSTVFARRPDGSVYAQTVNLDPKVRGLLDSQFAAGQGLNEAALRQIGYLPQDRFQLPTSPNARQYAADAFGQRTLDYNNIADPMSMGIYEATGVAPGASRQIGYNTTQQSLSPTASTDAIAQASYAQAKSMFEPDLQAQRKSLEINLANRGIPVGSSVYNDEMSRLDRQANNMYEQASRQAILDSGQEQSRQFGQNLQAGQFGQAEDQRGFQNAFNEANYYNSDDLARRNFLSGEDSRLAGQHLSNQQFLGQYGNQQYNQLMSALGYGNNAYQQNLSNVLLERNQPFAEASALLGTSPNFQTPQFMNTQALNVQTPDYLGVVNQNSRNAAQIQAAQMQANAQSSGGMWNAIGSIGAAALPLLSDENEKEDRRPADGESILFSIRGMPVDDYRYKDSAQAEYGVPEHRTGPMAQDWAEEFGGDGRTIDMADGFGKILAALKALDARTSKKRAA